MDSFGGNVRSVIFVETAKNSSTLVKRVREALVMPHEVPTVLTVLTALTFLRSLKRLIISHDQYDDLQFHSHKINYHVISSACSFEALVESP